MLRLGRFPRKVRRWTGLGGVTLAVLPVVALLLAQRPTAPLALAWAEGIWRPVEPALDWAPRLTQVEIRRAGSRNELVVVVHEPDGPGASRVWGSGRLDPTPDGNAKVRWRDGSNEATLQIRSMPGGRLLAVLRRREANRAPTGPEQIRQFWLERDDERPVADRGAEAVVAPAPGSRRPAATGPLRGEVRVLYAVEVATGALRVVAVPDGYLRAGNPSWSPDGARIAFTGFDATGRDPLVRIVEAQGGVPVAVAAGMAPSWSHDGSRLAYMASGRPEFATDWENPGRNDERIEAVRLTGPDAGTTEILARGIWPRFAPGDDRLAFVARVSGNTDIYVRSADGSTVTRITDDPATDLSPCWTQDGRGIVFLSNRGNRWDLYEAPVDGSRTVRRLTEIQRREDTPALHPNGKTVAFTDGMGRRDSQILLLDLSAGTVRPLLEPAGGERDPCWSPDGRQVAFVSRRPAPLVPLPGRTP